MHDFKAVAHGSAHSLVLPCGRPRSLADQELGNLAGFPQLGLYEQLPAEQDSAITGYQPVGTISTESPVPLCAT